MWKVTSEAINLQSRDAFWTLGGRDAPINVQIPAGSDFLYLDPCTTSPNVVLCVDVPGAGVSYMRPGDAIPANPRGGSVRIWNGLRRNMPAAFLASAYEACLVGYVGLKAGRADELGAVIASGTNQAPVPVCSLLFAGVVGHSTNIYIPTGSIKGVRISVLGWADPAGTPTTATNFAATVLVGAAVPKPPGFVNIATVGSPMPLPTMDDDIGGVYDVWNANEQLAFAGGATIYEGQEAYDRQVVAGSAAMILRVVNSIAGTGVFAAGVYLFVEGN